MNLSSKLQPDITGKLERAMSRKHESDECTNKRTLVLKIEKEREREWEREICNEHSAFLAISEDIRIWECTSLFLQNKAKSI